jgi:hypothetical protein
MYAGASDNSVERRVFRQHWLIKLVLPGLPWLVAIALISLAVLYCLPYSCYAPVLFAFAGVPFLKLFRLYLAWLGYSVSATTGSNVLVERSGLLSVSERLIPLTQFATVAYERPWWASLLPIDVGNAIVGAIGGPYVLPSMDDFSDLWEILQSRGQIVPHKRPSKLTILLALLWRSALVLSRLIFTGLSLLLSSLVTFGRTTLYWLVRGFSDLASSITNRLRQIYRLPAPFAGSGFTTDPLHETSSVDARRPSKTALRYAVPDCGHIYKGIPFTSQILSYAGFCAFCEQFVLTDNNWTRWHYRTPDPSRLYYPDGVSDHAALSYLHELRLACVLIPGPNGSSGERLSCRIRCIEDIKHLVPYFLEPPNRPV